MRLALNVENTGWLGSGTLRLVLVIAMSMVPEVNVELETWIFDCDAPSGYTIVKLTLDQRKNDKTHRS